MRNNKKIIAFVGGGTLGSVTPLINVWKGIDKRTADYEAVWLGTKNGPEVDQVLPLGIKYYSIISGKLRRYFSYKNFVDPFKIFFSFLQSLYILIKIRPAVVVGAGSFVQVPVLLSAFCLRIPTVIYQMDVKVGLANLLSSRTASAIAVALPGVVYPWNIDKQVFVGAVAPAIKAQGEGDGIVVFGGGTGAKIINDVVTDLVKNMPKDWKVTHVCGKGKINKNLVNKDNYYQHEHLSNQEMLELIRSSRVVIGRAGMGALFEIGAFGKSAIIIPIAKSHQEDNASYYANKNAVIVINQVELNAEVLIKEVIKIIAGDYPFLQKNIATITSYDGVDKLGALILKHVK